MRKIRVFVFNNIQLLCLSEVHCVARFVSKQAKNSNALISILTFPVAPFLPVNDDLRPGQRDLDHLKILGKVVEDLLRNGPASSHDVVGQDMPLEGRIGRERVGDRRVEIGGNQIAEGGGSGHKDQ